MNQRILLGVSILTVSAISSAQTFTIFTAQTNGLGGVAPLAVTTTSSGVIWATANRSAGPVPSTATLDFLAYVPSGIYNYGVSLYFAAPTTGTASGTISVSKVGPGYNGQDIDNGGGNYPFLGNPDGTPKPIQNQSILVNGAYETNYSDGYRTDEPPMEYMHFVLTASWSNATLQRIGIAVSSRDQAFGVVPEPAPLATLGFGALVLLRRRRRRKA